MSTPDRVSTPALAFISALGTLAVPGVACVLVPVWILNAAEVPLTPSIGLLQILAIPLAVLALYFILWVSTAFVVRGSGTPVPVEPPKHLVISGLYRYVRNPMYVGAVLLVLAEALYFQSGWLILYAVLIWAILHTALVAFEEPQLKRRFGAEYERYLQTVPRWIPKLPVSEQDLDCQ